jgi:hypothetical protein
MPNEVWNRLMVEGPENDVQRFIDRVVSKEINKYTGKPYILDFEAHVPVPADLPEEEVPGWAFSAWGCLQPTSAQIIEREPGRVVYFLITAVEVPIPWVESTAHDEPTLAFEHEYMEEFAQGWGRMRYEAGRLVRDDDIEPTDLEWVTWDEEEEEE